jgi:hypothetical protein
MVILYNTPQRGVINGRFQHAAPYISRRKHVAWPFHDLSSPRKWILEPIYVPQASIMKALTNESTVALICV